MSGRSTKLITILALAVILVVVIIVLTKVLKSNDAADAAKTEHFFNAANGAFVDENTKAIRGNNIFANHMMKAATPEEMLNNVRNDAYYAETGDLGATANTTGVNKLMANQVQINNINRKNGNAVMSEAEMRAIDKKIMTSAGNQIGSPFNRAGTIITELDVSPGRIQGLVNQNYISGRDKNHRVSVVKAVVPVKGFDISIDRLPEQMTMISSANFPANKKTVRAPGEAAARDSELLNIENQNAEGFKTTTGGYLVKNNTRF